MKKIVIYTAVFGKYDILPLHEKLPENVDLICFSDHELNAPQWNTRIVPAIYNDTTRNARKYKALPHRFLPEYDYSIWIDGNMKIRGDILSLCNDVKFYTYDHMQCFDKRDCIYDEARVILELGKRNMVLSPERGNLNWKDNPNIILQQMQRYKNEGFPAHYGLAETSVVIRQHNDLDIIKLNELWWSEMKYGSKRDQLSLNYASWKLNIPITYIPGDVRNNETFLMISGHKGKK